MPKIHRHPSYTKEILEKCESTKKLTPILRNLLTLVDEEAARNPEFAAKLESIMAELPTRPARPPRPPTAAVEIPDVFAALKDKGEVEFGFWVRTLDLLTLKAVIRANGLFRARPLS